MSEKDSAKPVVNFLARVLKFGKKGEKSGWTYIEIPAEATNKMLPGNKKSFRVKGKLDQFPINNIALLPMGKGVFIMPLNASMRKGTGKKEGATLRVQIQVDTKKPVLNVDLLKCLKEEPEAHAFFKQLAKSHQNYFSKWIDSAKTPETKAKRIARTLNALCQKMHYGEMLRMGQ